MLIRPEPTHFSQQNNEPNHREKYANKIPYSTANRDTKQKKMEPHQVKIEQLKNVAVRNLETTKTNQTGKKET
jgi:hypothetical protein